MKIVLRAYCHRRTAKEAMAQSGLSHVTVYRIYRYIRERLIAAEVFPTLSAFFKEMDIRENEGSPMFDDGAAMDEIDRQVGAHRGVRPQNRPAYVSEKLYLTYGEGFTPAQLYRLVLLSTKAFGPLNRPPRAMPDKAFSLEIWRIWADQVDREFRRINRELRDEGDEPMTYYENEPVSDVVGRMIDKEKALRRATRAKKKKPEGENR